MSARLRNDDDHATVVLDDAGSVLVWLCAAYIAAVGLLLGLALL
jgi:hypothetical protein